MMVAFHALAAVSLLLMIPQIFAAEAGADKPPLNCYKYFNNKATGLSFVDPVASEKETTTCDQCFSYVCYKTYKEKELKENEYIIGSGCREDFFRDCGLKPSSKEVVAGESDKDACGFGKNYIVGYCLKDFCNHEGMADCIPRMISKEPKKDFALKSFADIQFRQETPAAAVPATNGCGEEGAMKIAGIFGVAWIFLLI